MKDKNHCAIIEIQRRHMNDKDFSHFFRMTLENKNEEELL